MNENKITDFEPITEKQVHALIKALGRGAMIIDFNNIDYNLGRGVDGEGHCLWNKDGRKISIGGYKAGLMVSQSHEPDPFYREYKDSECFECGSQIVNGKCSYKNCECHE